MEQMPKTLECCGRKPKRKRYQTGHRDEVNIVVLECRVCKNKIVEEDDSQGDYMIELKAVKRWNELVGKTGGVNGVTE